MKINKKAIFSETLIVLLALTLFILAIVSFWIENNIEKYTNYKVIRDKYSEDHKVKRDIYFLIANDSTHCKVDLGTYVSKQIGDEAICWWEE